jgi:hypothetical protein
VSINGNNTTTKPEFNSEESVKRRTITILNRKWNLGTDNKGHKQLSNGK